MAQEIIAEQAALDEEESRQTMPRSPRFNRQMNVKDKGGENADDDSFDPRTLSKKALFKAATSNITIFAITICIALIGDGLGFIMQILPGLGGILAALTITPIATLAIWSANSLAGIKYSKKATKILLVCVGLEFIPIINALPALTAGVILMKMNQIAEDVVPGNQSRDGGKD